MDKTPQSLRQEGLKGPFQGQDPIGSTPQQFGSVRKTQVLRAYSYARRQQKTPESHKLMSIEFGYIDGIQNSRAHQTVRQIPTGSPGEQ